MEYNNVAKKKIIIKFMINIEIARDSQLFLT